jgi:hypothetical protein
VRLVARLVERGARLRNLGARRLECLEPLGHRQIEQLDRFGQFAHLALGVDHACRDLIALAARDTAVRVENRPVERHEGGGDARIAQAARHGAVGYDDGVADKGTDQGLILRREAKRVGEADRALFVHRQRGVSAGDERRVQRHDRRAALSSLPERIEQLSPSLDVVHDDVLQSRSE